MNQRYKPELPRAARAYFAECGRRGGLAGDPLKKKLSPEMVRAISEINRTRRRIKGHVRTCPCECCVRYWRAKEQMQELRKGG